MLDKLKSEGIRQAINLFLKGKYGKVTSLSIDKRNQQISASLLLNGEQQPVDLKVGEYSFDDSDPSRPRIVLRKIAVSRPWMQELAADHVENKPIDLPPQAAAAVKKVL